MIIGAYICFEKKTIFISTRINRSIVTVPLRLFAFVYYKKLFQNTSDIVTANPYKMPPRFWR